MDNLTLNTATIELLSKCNFHCRHCYLDKKSAKSLSITDWFKVFDTLYNVGVKKVVLTGGEPLMHPQFKSIYSYIHNLGLELQVFTNGSLLDKAWIDFFKTSLPKSVSVSVYGQNQQQYEKFTGSRAGVFDSVINNIESLKREGIKTYIGITPYQCEMNEQWYAFIREHDININTYMIPSLDRQNNLGFRLTPEAIVEIETRLHQQREVTKIPITPNDSDYYRKCSGGMTSLFIDQHGYVSMCAVNRKLKFNILTVSFETIRTELINESERIKRAYFSSQCGSCKHNKGCRNCPVYSELEGNSGGENPYLCALTSERIKVRTT
ncbi:radical SAM protein [uncultured Shewanella sp.]|uniref:radical SAM protein n=1 Tax=uncultured Shewanella sp. TaxID=173975 RepID=UPI002611ED5F|nr:radical SAM protein [uncultured Shewanella sp.]